MKIFIEVNLRNFWPTPEELSAMSDEEIVEMCLSDAAATLDGAQWNIEREEGEV